MTKKERLELQQQFCAQTVADMSEKDRISFAYNVLMDSYYEGYSDEQFLAEVQEFMPNLLTIDVKAEEEGSD
jgi:hypothetical protein